MKRINISAIYFVPKNSQSRAVTAFNILKVFLKPRIISIFGSFLLILFQFTNSGKKNNKRQSSVKALPRMTSDYSSNALIINCVKNIYIMTRSRNLYGRILSSIYLKESFFLNLENFKHSAFLYNSSQQSKENEQFIGM